MFYDKYFPFYAAYAHPLFYEGERMQEKEFELMKSYYPAAMQKIQETVEMQCQQLDYEGSWIYDAYPDKYMLYHLCAKIKESIKPEVQEQGMSHGLLDELVQVLLCQEISRRRCRRHRCRRYF